MLVRAVRCSEPVVRNCDWKRRWVPRYGIVRFHGAESPHRAISKISQKNDNSPPARGSCLRVIALSSAAGR